LSNQALNESWGSLSMAETSPRLALTAQPGARIVSRTALETGSGFNRLSVKVVLADEVDQWQEETGIFDILLIMPDHLPLDMTQENLPFDQRAFVSLDERRSNVSQGSVFAFMRFVTFARLDGRFPDSSETFTYLPALRFPVRGNVGSFVVVGEDETVEGNNGVNRGTAMPVTVSVFPLGNAPHRSNPSGKIVSSATLAIASFKTLPIGA